MATLPHKFLVGVKNAAACKTCGETESASIHIKNQPFEYDPVKAPFHYSRHKVTTVQLIPDWNLDFYLGNVVKYIERHDAKGGIEDLKKAREYLAMKIELIETGQLKESIKHG